MEKLADLESSEDNEDLPNGEVEEVGSEDTEKAVEVSLKKRGRKRKVDSAPPAETPIFDVGEVVFAQVRGYPFWPARVEAKFDNVTGKPHHQRHKVFFYGSHDYGFCKPYELRTYIDHKAEYQSKCKSAQFKKALWEAEHDPEVIVEERPSKMESSSDDDHEVKKSQRKSSTHKRGASRNGCLVRSRFTDRAFFFGSFYDAGVKDEEKEGGPSIRHIRVRRMPRDDDSMDCDDDGVVSEDRFNRSIKKVKDSIASLKSSSVSPTILDLVFNLKLSVDQARMPKTTTKDLEKPKSSRSGVEGAQKSQPKKHVDLLEDFTSTTEFDNDALQQLNMCTKGLEEQLQANKKKLALKVNNGRKKKEQ